MARRPPGDLLAGYWEFPGGKPESGEDHVACLKRELQEELEIMAEIGEPFAESLYDTGTRVIRLVCCHARYLGGDIRLHAHDVFRWCTPVEMSELDVAPADLQPRAVFLRFLAEKANHTGIRKPR